MAKAVQAKALPAIGLFVRSASPGRAKTRLIPLLGARGAADFHVALVSDAIDKINRLKGRAACSLFVAGGMAAFPALSGWTLHRQRGRDLGERLERAFHSLLRRHPRAVILASDAPMLHPRVLRGALEELRACDAVLGPSPDGGYYLVGLRRFSLHQTPNLFRNVRWGSEHAFADTLRNFLERGLICSILEPVEDVDRPEDVRRLERRLNANRAARRAAPAVWRFLKARSAK